MSSMKETARLRLETLDSATARAIAADDRNGRTWHPQFPREDDRDAARMMVEHPHPEYGCRVVVERSSNLAVGTIGFFGPPDDDGTVMVGYGLVPAARGHGYATEALRAMVDFAFARPAVRTVTADPLADNVASHRVLEKAGFCRTHSTDDADWYAVARSSRHRS